MQEKFEKEFYYHGKTFLHLEIAIFQIHLWKNIYIPAKYEKWQFFLKEMFRYLVEFNLPPWNTRNSLISHKSDP